MRISEFTLAGQTSIDGTERIEVGVVSERHGTNLEVRLLSWGEGVGWYIQKRIRLDRQQVQFLRNILGRDEAGFRCIQSDLTSQNHLVRRTKRPSPPSNVVLLDFGSQSKIAAG